jgi:hypothetical protein
MLDFLLRFTHCNFKHHLLEVCELTFSFEGDLLPFLAYHIAYVYTQTKHAQIIGPIKLRLAIVM